MPTQSGKTLFSQHYLETRLPQLLNYLKAYRLEVELLLNFGSKNLTLKRLVL
jgi:hypothetical protein